MAALVVHHDACLDHIAGYGHPERPARVQAALRGIRAAGFGEAVTEVEARRATPDELAVIHPPGYVEAVRRRTHLRGGMDSGERGVVSATVRSACRRGR